MRVSDLPRACLHSRVINSINLITDDALAEHCGVRIAFTGRNGGVSVGSYSSLNLATHVGDDADAVQQNRARVLDALQATDMELVSANQVHEDHLVSINSDDIAALDEARLAADAGADGFIVSAENVATLLCFADCIPVAIVSPTGSFALVHAGWRGVAASIAPKAVVSLAKRESAQESRAATSAAARNPQPAAQSASRESPREATSQEPPQNDRATNTTSIPDTAAPDAAAPFDSPDEAAASYNVYIGPYLRKECFEVGKDVYDRLIALGGAECAPDECHIDLGRVLINDLMRVGISADRIADADICTKCNSDLFYSYRGCGGTCGRHGALAFRLSR